MFYRSCCFGGTPEQPEDDPSCFKLFAEITNRDNAVDGSVFFYFGMTSFRETLKYSEKTLKRHTCATFSDTGLVWAWNPSFHSEKLATNCLSYDNL
jgi:hypothetical protein